MHGLDEFKGEFEEDLDALLNSIFVGVAFVLLVKYDEVPGVEELEGDYTDPVVREECLFLG